LAEKNFFHSLKQALYLLYNSTKVFNEVTVEQQRNIWQSIMLGTTNSMYYKTIDDLKPNINLVKLLPIRFLRADQPTVQRPIKVYKSTSASESNVEKTLGDLCEELNDLLVGNNSANKKFVIQGITVSLDAPIYAVWKHFAHADFFLYISIINEK
jgi:phosphoribosylformylglycinamidine (FGAM) synthase-like enzyme